jgi:putative redox protein
MRFTGTSGAASIALDGAGGSEPTPVQTLAFSLAACMSIDVVHILTKRRHVLKALRAHLDGKRRDLEPKHFTAIRLHFTVAGDIPRDAVERAITLSREKYCSVWLSLRQDIELSATFDIVPG